MLFGFRGSKKTTQKKNIKYDSSEFDAALDFNSMEAEEENNNDDYKDDYKEHHAEEEKKQIHLDTKFYSNKLLDNKSQMLSFYDEDDISENINPMSNTVLNKKRPTDHIIDSQANKKQKYNSLHLPPNDTVHDMDEFAYNLIDEDKFDNAANTIHEKDEVLNTDTEYLIPEEESSDAFYKSKIDQIKQLREKKRLNEFKEEKYDQDYVEMKGINSKELIKDVYDFINQHDVFDLKRLEDNSDSEKELLQWEMGKLKNGMNAHWAFNQQKIKQKAVGRDINEIFKNVNVSVDINEIIGKVKEDIEKEDLHAETLNVRLENYKTEIEENTHKKMITIQKVDDYVSQYQNLKRIYAQLLKQIKKNGHFCTEKILEKFDEELFYFSD